MLRAYKELTGDCSFLETEFSRQHASVDFESYDDLLQSIIIAESLESIRPVMFEVLGAVLEDVPVREHVQGVPRASTSRVGEVHALETLQTVDALNGARSVFQGDEDSSVLVKETDLDKPDPEQDDAIDECDTPSN